MQVSDLLVHENDLVIATHGRSMYVLDDIAPIRELGPTFAGAPFKVMKPRVATRDVDEAVIQYALARQADSVRIEILDASREGRAHIQRWRRRASRLGQRSHRGPARQRATRSPARRRRIRSSIPPGCETFAGRTSRRSRRHTTQRSRGTQSLRLGSALSGRDDLSMPHPLERERRAGTARRARAVSRSRHRGRANANATARRPHGSATQGRDLADLREQFALATQIRDKLSAANEAVLRIRRLKSAIAQRVAHAEAPEIVASANDVTHKLTAVEENLYQVRNRSGQDPLNFPIKLNNRIGALGRSVSTGDARPTAAVVHGVPRAVRRSSTRSSNSWNT